MVEEIELLTSRETRDPVSLTAEKVRLGPTGCHRVLQVHPTRRCNLRCLHCYSSSGPDVRESLDIPVLTSAIRDAARLGYTTLAVSGGEPLMYAPLPRVLETAQANGMLTTVTTNGMLLSDRLLKMLGPVINLIAISLDGIPESHNLMRNSDRAFDKMATCLERLRQLKIPFGFIFTLTLHNVHELDWVAKFAIEEGASLLQIHPLEETGRAALKLRGSRPDATETGWAFLEVMRLQAVAGDRLRIQLDLTDQAILAEDPSRVFADQLVMEDSLPFAHLVSPLIIEANGMVVPLQYGFARSYSLGNVKTTPLFELAHYWRQVRYPAFRRLCRNVFRTLQRRKKVAMLNWYEKVSVAAEHEISTTRPVLNRVRVRG